jgi:hypothetical protein
VWLNMRSGLSLHSGFLITSLHRPPTFTAMFCTSEYDQAQGPHDGPPAALIVPIVLPGGHPTFTAPLVTSDYDQAQGPRHGPPASLIGLPGGHPTFTAPSVTSEYDHSRATRSASGHGDDRWEHTEILPGERGGAGASKAALSTRSATVVNSDCAKSPCRVEASSSSSLFTTRVTSTDSDVHRNTVATHESVGVTDVHCDNGDDDGDFDRPGGDSRVTVPEAAGCVWCEQSPALLSNLRQQASPRPDSKESKSNPLGKGLNHDLTVLLNRLPDNVPLPFKILRRGEPVGDPILKNPIFAAQRPREAPSFNLPRGTGPLRKPQGPGSAGGVWSAKTRTSVVIRACQQRGYRWG